MKLFPPNFLISEFHEQIWPEQMLPFIKHPRDWHISLVIFIITNIQKGRCFTDEKVKAQKGQVTCQGYPHRKL